MRTIMVMNAKGGCGKTTLATNIAAYYADDGVRVALADLDPQSSAMDWLQARQQYTGIPEIEGIAAPEGQFRAPRATDLLVLDVPAGTHGKQIAKLLRRVDTLLVPILPSAIDMRAASRFLSELLDNGRVSSKQTRVACVANRVRENTIAAQELEQYLAHTAVPCVATLRESQNYIRSAETGLGLFEMAPSSVFQDVEQWDPLVQWLDSRSSQPLSRK